MKPTTRKVVKRSPANTVRLLHLPHLQAEPVEAESALERDFVHVAALFPFTTHIEHQPFKLVWNDSSYTPDFLLTFLDQSKLVIEVKPSSKVAKYEELFQRAEEKLRTKGLSFYVATDTRICVSGRPANALLIRRYAKTVFPADACRALVERATKNSGGLTVKDLCEADAHSLSLLRHVIGKRLLTTAPDLGTKPNSIIHTPISMKGQSHALQFTSWFNT